MNLIKTVLFDLRLNNNNNNNNNNNILLLQPTIELYQILFLSNLSKLISWQMSPSFPNNNSKLKSKYSVKIGNGKHGKCSSKLETFQIPCYIHTNFIIGMTS